MFTVLIIYNLTTWQRFLVAPFRALWERGASYRQLRSLRSLTGGYACVALRAVNAAFGGNGVAEASRLRMVIRGRCPRATARTPPPHRHALWASAVLQTGLLRHPPLA